MKITVFFFLFFLYYAIAEGQQNIVRVDNHKGTPTLMVDGRPDAGMTYMTYRPKEAYFRDFGNADVNFVSFSTALHEVSITLDGNAEGSTVRRLREPVWVSRDSFNFRAFDSTVQFILRANPRALIFPRVYLFAPEWWMAENPDELMVYHDGIRFKPTRGWSSGTTLPSWASDKWRKDTGNCLRMLIQHIRKQEWGSRIVGYHLASGGTDEWYYYCYYNWFFNAPQEDFLDFGIPQTRAYRTWLKKKYGTLEMLRSAWHNDTVSFENARLASKNDRKNSTLFLLYDPSKSMHVIDSWDFESEMIAETIAYFCRVVKEETDGNAFTGAFYGYILGANDKGYCATRSLLNSGDIDFLTSPSGYWFREPGWGYSSYRSPVRSVQMAGKVWWDENDYYTYLTPPWKWVEGWTGPRDFPTTLNQQLRQLAAQIHHGAAGWWFDMEGGWFDSPEAMKMIKKLNEIGSNSVLFDRSSLAEVAVVVDEKSMLYMGMGSDLYNSLILEQPLEFGRIGTPVDWILADDIGKSSQYKMYIMLNLFHVTGEVRNAIDRLRKGVAKAILWVYAPGLMTDHADVSNCESLTGIKLSMLFDKSPLQIEITDDGHKFFGSLPSGYIYGTQNKIGPVMVADDPAAKTLGELYGFGLPGLVYKNISGIHTYYSASPKLSHQLLRAIAIKSGVHIYNDIDDGTYVNKSFVSIHAVRNGHRKLSFPKPVSLYDVYQDKVVAKGKKKISVEMAPRTTVIYFIGSEQSWKEELKLNKE
jgi:beta-galactosidase